MPGRKVETKLSGPAFEITLNRPERKNALDLDMVEELLSVLEAAEKSPARAVVLRGAGGSFCSGADLSEFAEGGGNPRSESILRFGEAFESVCLRISGLELPVVAAIEGPALGGGATLALYSDFRLATPDLRLGIPASKLGITLSEKLVRRIVAVAGQRGAAELLLRSRELTSAEALSRGVIDEIVDDSDELRGRAMAVVDQISDGIHGSVAAHKRAIGRILSGEA